MFEKKKNEFGDKGFKMKDYYEADNLFVARLQRISSRYIEFGPMVETTEQKYIFELVKDGKNIRYREIFTGFITDKVDDTSKGGFDFKYFDLPYVFEPEKYTKYFPQVKGLTLPKLSLIWTQNDLNYPKEKEFFKTKKKEC